MPTALSSYRVVVIETGEDVGCWQSEAELAACLAFGGLVLQHVLITADVPVTNGITSWT